jgi:hypothetical protein
VNHFTNLVKSAAYFKLFAPSAYPGAHQTHSFTEIGRIYWELMVDTSPLIAILKTEQYYNLLAGKNLKMEQ